MDSIYAVKNVHNTCTIYDNVFQLNNLKRKNEGVSSLQGSLETKKNRRKSPPKPDVNQGRLNIKTLL